MNAGPVLELRDVSKTYRSSWSPFKPSVRTALRTTSLELAKGDTLGVVGESGSGKTTLARIASALVEPDSGQVSVRGIRVSGLPERERRPLRRHFQMIFQDPFASLNPRMSIIEAVTEPVRFQLSLASDECSSRAREALELVGISPSLGKRYPHELSGGQRQRAAIARALVTEPDLLIADEPVSSLDVSIQASILNLLKDIQSRTNCSYLFISHDLKLVSYMSRMIRVMYDGLTVETGPAEEIRLRPLHPYTRRMIVSIPSILSKSGETPGADSPPSSAIADDAATCGCPYYPRCPWRKNACAVELPVLKTASPGREIACFNPGAWREPA